MFCNYYNRFILHEIKIGDIVLINIEVSASENVQAPMLFGQSGISKFGNYKLDLQEDKVILER